MDQATDSNPRPPATGWRAVTPNAITLARLGLTVWFLGLLSTADVPYRDGAPNLLAWPGADWAIDATVLFVIAALTDALDGYLARRWNAVSRFGRIMDPLADKLLVLGAFVMLSGSAIGPYSGVAPWMTVVILARELLVTTARASFEASGIDFSAAWSGKIKMIVQSVAIPLLLLLMVPPGSDGADPWPPNQLAAWIAWGVTLVTAASVVPYGVRILSLSRASQTTGHGGAALNDPDTSEDRNPTS